MNTQVNARTELREWLRLRKPKSGVTYFVGKIETTPSFERRSITYRDLDGNEIPAFLLVPHSLREPAPAIVIHHQHNGERHFGKSEVCGLVGNPLQAFGPALAERGFIVLAPDSICFEDRRVQCSGTEPHAEDWLQHYNEMSYRLLSSDTLMRQVLEDAEAAVSVLSSFDEVDSLKIGVLGHSYGGNTALFQAALDERVRYACSSGAVCSYRNKMENGTGIEMAEVLPGALARFDIDDLISLSAPRRFLVVSAANDKYSRDADVMAERGRIVYRKSNAESSLQHYRYDGGHNMTPERFNQIVEWLSDTVATII